MTEPPQDVPQAEPQAAPDQTNRRRALILTGGVTFAVVIALVVSAFLVIDNKAGKAEAKKEDLQVVEYQKPSDAGDDPFTSTADVDGDKVVRFKRTSGTADPHEPFGGSGSLHVCDREALVTFLVGHKQQRRVWAGVLGIDSDKESVSRYVRSLTPVTLTVDTRVTNHMYVNGRAVPFQSILAAGTAVLVDKYGQPVVRCKCGNPLLMPRDYPRIHCHGCPPHYKPPKWCKWRTYDPWYGYPPEWLPPEWRDPYPTSYPKPKPWVYKHGKYCYIVYPDPPEIDYPPRWYPPEPTYVPQQTYRPRPRYNPPDHSDDSDYTSDDYSDTSDSDSGAGGCCGGGKGSDSSGSGSDSSDSDYWAPGSM